jgi:hypothetical protein
MSYGSCKVERSYRYSKVFTAIVPSSDSTVRADVFYRKHTFKPRENLRYYWFYMNEIRSTVGGYDGKLLHGNYRSYHSNGNLKEFGHFRKGCKTGKWLSWNQDGAIREKSFFRNGQKVSPVFTRKILAMFAQQ